MDMKPSSNAPGFVRVGLAALLVSALYPAYQLVMLGMRYASADLSTILFRAGLFFVALGVAIRHGWLVATPSDAAQLDDAAGDASPRS
jgi:hypothetical protein